MAVTGLDFAGFDRALIIRTVGLNAEARKQAAAALFASLYLERPEPEELGRSIVLWDELMNGRRGAAR